MELTSQLRWRHLVGVGGQRYLESKCLFSLPPLLSWCFWGLSYMYKDLPEIQRITMSVFLPCSQVRHRLHPSALCSIWPGPRSVRDVPDINSWSLRSCLPSPSSALSLRGWGHSLCALVRPLFHSLGSGPGWMGAVRGGRWNQEVWGWRGEKHEAPFVPIEPPPWILELEKGRTSFYLHNIRKDLLYLNFTYWDPGQTSCLQNCKRIILCCCRENGASGDRLLWGSVGYCCHLEGSEETVWATGRKKNREWDPQTPAKGTTEDEMVGWHHWLDEHEFEQAYRVGDGQGSLACCSSWDHRVRHNWVTELNWTCSSYGSVFSIFTLCPIPGPLWMLNSKGRMTGTYYKILLSFFL